MDRAATISQTMEQIDLSDQTATDNYSFDPIKNLLKRCDCIASAFSVDFIKQASLHIAPFIISIYLQHQEAEIPQVYMVR